MATVVEIKDMEVAKLQSLITKYPWFSYAREVLLCKLVEIEPQCLESRYKETLAFFPKRESVYFRCKSIIAAKEQASKESAGDIQVEENEVVPLEELSLDVDFLVGSDSSSDEPAFDIVMEREEQESVIEIAAPKPKVVVVGGDYFSKEDFAQLEEEEKVADIKFGAPAVLDAPEGEKAEDSDDADFDSFDFVTETLAKIYADQGYYDKAIEVYAKLILLYPEKSTYFATLVNEIKSKN